MSGSNQADTASTRTKRTLRTRVSSAGGSRRRTGGADISEAYVWHRQKGSALELPIHRLHPAPRAAPHLGRATGETAHHVDAEEAELGLRGHELGDGRGYGVEA